MGKVIINGKTYDSLTGLQIVDDNHAKSKIEIDSAPVKTTKEIPAPVSPAKAQAPKVKRVSRQERLAAAVAQEFASEDPAPHKKKTARAAKPKAITSEASAPGWIANFVEGHDPIEIEPIRLDTTSKPNQLRQRKHSPAQHYGRNRAQRSQTLNRHFVKKPAESLTYVSVNRRSAPVVNKHPDVHRFALTNVATAAKSPKINTATKKTVSPPTPDTPFVPVVSHHAAKKLVSAPQKPTLSGSELKDFLIKSQLDQPIDKKTRRRAEKSAAKLGTRRHFTRTSLVTAALAVAILGGYMTYISMPSISIRVAANRAGVDSQIPYTPNGYSLDGPVAYSPGQLTIKYKSNSGGSGYSITEQTTVLDSREAFSSSSENGSSYTTEDLNGTTVYYYGNNAAWVKDGVLYTLSGNHLLGNDQVSKIIQSV